MEEYLGSVTKNANLPKSMKNLPKEVHNFSKFLNGYSRRGQKLFKSCLSGDISPNLVTVPHEFLEIKQIGDDAKNSLGTC